MILDIAVLAVLLVSAIIAFLRGFIREVLTILGVVGGLAAAYFGGPHLSPVVRGMFTPGEGEEPEKFFDIIPYDVAADAIAYGSIFIIVVIVLSIASHFIAGWAKAIGLGAVDRTLGVMFGLVRGAVILGLLYLPAYMIVDKETRGDWFKDSRTHFYLDASAGWMVSALPESFTDDIKKKTEEAGESMAESTREKLQELDVLRSEGGEDALKDERAGPPKPVEDPASGYGQDQRENLNELFEDNLND